MRRLLMILFLLGSLSAASAADVATGRVVKGLPLFFDLKGRAATSQSLFDRDAYQAYLRQHMNEISAVRFDVLWSASHADKADLKLRLELRGADPDSLPLAITLEQMGAPNFFRYWTSLTLGGHDLKIFGNVISWRVTL